jgi:nucleoid-associated protein YgaU
MFDLTAEHAFDRVIHMDRTPVRVIPGPYGSGRTALRQRRAPAVASQEADSMAKLTTPARVVVLLTAIVVLVVLLLANAVGARGADDQTGAVEHGTHLVETGDTLWDIAAEHTAPGEDVRRVVYEIQRLNGLDGSVILPGRVLQVPLPG